MRIALFRSTVGFQADIVPSSVAKMKKAELDTPFSETTKSSESVLLKGLKTTPVGAAVVPAGLPAGGGIVTTNGIALPSPLYSVETPAPLSDTHQGLVGP